MFIPYGKYLQSTTVIECQWISVFFKSQGNNKIDMGYDLAAFGGCTGHVYKPLGSNEKMSPQQ
jgi:hypothetical protein